MLPPPSFTAPSVQELAARKTLILEKMACEELDYFVFVNPDNIYWMTHFANFVHERPFVLILSKDGNLRFVIPKLEIPHVKTRSIGNIELLPYVEFPAPEGQDWKSVFSPLFQNNDKVGIELTCPHYVSASIWGQVYASEIPEKTRYIKSKYEISRIRYASDIATKQLQTLLEKAKINQSMLSIHTKTSKLSTLQLLLDNPEVNMLATHAGVVVQPPEISHDPHNFTNVTKLGITEDGPHVSIVAGVFNGWGTEVERTFFVGKVPEAARRPFEVMMAVRRKVYEMVKPGNSMHEVDMAANNHFRNAGYGENLLHRTGHGIGVTGHEGPFLAEGYHHEIKPGMVFTIEPGIYIEGLGGFRHSDTVLVTEEGNVCLTPVADSLEELTLPARGLRIPKHKEIRNFFLRTYGRMNGLKIG